MVINDPVVLYGMLLSKGGRILVHSAPALEGAKVENEGKASLLFASAREFPRGHLGYEEFIYEVRTPLTIGGEDKHMLVLGLSLKEIDKHIDEVRGEVRFKMLLSAAIGLAVLVVPGIGLWVVLRRYRQLARKARDMALMAQMGQMANGLAHEIRNPLNAVRFNLRIMEEDIDHFPEDVREGYKQIIRRASGEIDRVGGLLTEYLSYVRPGHREPAFYDVSAIVESVLDFVEYECRRYNIAIVRDLSPNLPKVLGDEKRLKQAVLNIVLNAQRTLRPSGGAIRARTHQDNGSVVLEIADNGPGVPEEERQKIFEPFYSTREGGTGLGLAIVQRVMEDHGGTIGCGCAEGGGAVFVATFPRQRERPHQAGTVERK
ncbi:MAG: hypothetical protein GWP08_14390 [Nitrospiraceae bacterium]|nr:hypothetical protein [Nitrospiraceae bacterium]